MSTYPPITIDVWDSACGRYVFFALVDKAYGVVMDCERVDVLDMIDIGIIWERMWVKGYRELLTMYGVF